MSFNGTYDRVIDKKSDCNFYQYNLNNSLERKIIGDEDGQKNYIYIDNSNSC